jgi:DNA replication protein DnaT
MRRPWIKIEVSTPDKPEICALAKKLRLDADSVMGKLVRLWSWAELSNANPNDLNVTKEFIDRVCGRKGFAEALMQVGWLQEDGENLFFPHFSRHNGNASKVRGLTARRVELHRHRKGKSDDSTVARKRQKPLLSNTVNNVTIEPEPQLTVGEPTLDPTQTAPAIQTLSSLPENVPSHNSDLSEPSVHPDPIEAETKTKKKRGKPDTSLDDQPMLF